MKERPILFSAPMIRALLDGTKTQTRRIVNPQPEPDEEYGGYHWPSHLCQSMVGIDAMGTLGPYGKPGDQLWCRETWGLHDTQPKDGPRGATVFYRATEGERHDLRYQLWRPSIFMPRWASRISLEIAAIRVERLQDISEDDAKAEGVRPFFEVYDCFGPDQRICTGELARDFPYRASYACLWDEINGDRALWNTTPWVWVIEFTRLEKP